MRALAAASWCRTDYVSCLLDPFFLLDWIVGAFSGWLFMVLRVWTFKHATLRTRLMSLCSIVTKFIQDEAYLMHDGVPRGDHVQNLHGDCSSLYGDSATLWFFWPGKGDSGILAVRLRGETRISTCIMAAKHVRSLWICLHSFRMSSSLSAGKGSNSSVFVKKAGCSQSNDHRISPTLFLLPLLLRCSAGAAAVVLTDWWRYLLSID